MNFSVWRNKQMDAKPSEIVYGTGRFNRSELLNLREALDDRKTMEKIKIFREARQRLSFLTKSQENDKGWQLGELCDSQARVQNLIKTLNSQARHLSTLARAQEQEEVTGTV